MADVVLVPCADYDPAHVRPALEALLARVGGLDWIRPGMRIGIKANLVAAMSPDSAATTHPALISALVELLQARGAVAAVGDSPACTTLPSSTASMPRPAWTRPEAS